MKLLVFGEIGQLGQELIRRAGDVALEVRGLEEADFTNPASCVGFIEATDADAVINAVAYTAVDKAEEQEDLALQINGTTPALMAKAAAARGLPFVQVSTDYVFDGSGDQPFTPDHPTGPLGAYGRTKLAGEEGVIQAGGAYAILRTSWVVSSHGHNFVKTMLRLGKERDALTIVADQIGGPTPAAGLADACIGAAKGLLEDPEGKTGIYHCSGGPDVSWADFAREIFAQAGIDCAVTDIPSSDYPTPAVRPLNSRMDCTTLTTVLGVPRPDWRAGLSDILNDLGERST
ncbi:NAD(P)-dependent oxidoreductase [Roseobacter cerasinus]|uniref:dTDP-4-dehydrorhamnose reductase n=1 Tax=Roseobacter cerasinus TaxID=2602289 RepID=A0A640VXR5_9RHOB|nr:dTDP-4-dehydrorhamnose reductase [Roseobacter cerasinus]GFE52472.1 NAD(P)-dependent oxidoreductase [Roseobacter cerasinus]